MSKRVRDSLVIAGMIFAYSVFILWVFGWIAGAIIFYPKLVQAITDFGILPGAFPMFMLIWFVFTIIYVGYKMALQGFKMIGTWVTPK